MYMEYQIDTLRTVCPKLFDGTQCPMCPQVISVLGLDYELVIHNFKIAGVITTNINLYYI